MNKPKLYKKYLVAHDEAYQTDGTVIRVQISASEHDVIYINVPDSKDKPIRIGTVDHDMSCTDQVYFRESITVNE